MKYIARAILACLFVVITSPQASSQGIVNALQQIPVTNLVSILDAWDKGELKFPPKKDLTDEFQERIKWRLTDKPAGYEDNKWSQLVTEFWAGLPMGVDRRLPLTAGAKLVIVGGFVDNLNFLAGREDHTREKLPPALVHKYSNILSERNALLSELRVPLFMLLGRAQSDAIRAKGNAISSFHIQRAILASRTGIFPICVLESPSMGPGSKK